MKKLIPILEKAKVKIQKELLKRNPVYIDGFEAHGATQMLFEFGVISLNMFLDTRLDVSYSLGISEDVKASVAIALQEFDAVYSVGERYQDENGQWFVDEEAVAAYIEVLKRDTSTDFGVQQLETLTEPVLRSTNANKFH